MKNSKKKYCLDANVLIEAWNKYYSPKYCPDYWDVLNKLGEQNIIFIPEQVHEEIVKSDDELSIWLKNSNIAIHTTNKEITDHLSTIFKSDPSHKRLVDSKKGRSLADPWVIAHAIHQKAAVVTKEHKITTSNSSQIRIPNVCENMGIKWINDFEFVEEVKIIFTCALC